MEIIMGNGYVPFQTSFLVQFQENFLRVVRRLVSRSPESRRKRHVVNTGTSACFQHCSYTILLPTLSIRTSCTQQYFEVLAPDRCIDKPIHQPCEVLDLRHPRFQLRSSHFTLRLELRARGLTIIRETEHHALLIRVAFAQSCKNIPITPTDCVQAALISLQEVPKLGVHAFNP
jgi:hypothetical protein